MICGYMLHLAREFAKKELVFGFLLYEKPYFLWRDMFNNKGKLWEKKDGIFMIRPLYILPLAHRFLLVRTINQYLHALICFPLIVRWIKWRQKARTYGKPIFVFYHPEKEVVYFRFVCWVFSITHMTLFDLVDYPPVHREPKALAIYEDYIKKTDIVTVNSHTLYHIFSRVRRDIHIVPPGFADEDFIHIRSSSLRQNNKPTIGFVGSMGSRLDYSLLEELIRKNPQWNFLFWGPTEIVEGEDRKQIEKNIASLFRYKNVMHGASKDRLTVASVFQNIDIGIIPYAPQRTQNRYSFPMKFFEYLCMGKPVVSTSIVELRRFSEFVKIGSTSREWEQHIREWLEVPLTVSQRRMTRRLAMENRWEKKAEAIFKLVL